MWLEFHSKIPQLKNGLNRHQKTTWTVWSKEINVIVLKCSFLSSPTDKEENTIRGYRKKCMTSGRNGFESNRTKFV